MIKRTREQWLALFEACQQSGLSQAEFCQAQGLCPKYFSVRRRQLRGAGESSPFVRVQQDPPEATDVLAVEWQLQIGSIQLRVRNASVEQMLALLKGLA